MSQVRIPHSIALLVFIFLGVLGSCLIQPVTVYASPASTVGVVDYQLLINQNPATPQANTDLQAAQTAAKAEFDTKSAGMSDADKQALSQQLSQQIEQKREALLKPIIDQINAAIKAVAEEKGLTIIVPKTVVVYGGMDITNDVMKKITGQ